MIFLGTRFASVSSIAITKKRLQRCAPTMNMTVFLTISKVFLGSTEDRRREFARHDIVGFSSAPRKKG